MSITGNKNNTINEFIDYTRSEKINNQKISFANEILIINTIPLNYNLKTHYGILAVSIFLIWNFQGDSNVKLAIIALIPVSVFCIWKEFQYVNKTIIDFKNKSVTIIPKNLLKKLFVNEKLLHFKDIDSFFYDETNLFNKGIMRLAILVKLKDGSSLRVTALWEKKYAEKITSYLNSFID